MKYHLLVLFLLCVIAHPAVSQQYITHIQSYGIKDGLTDHYAYAILEDNNGFAWIGSAIGPLRFDGYSFKPFTKQNAGLTNSKTSDIFQDIKGNLWIFSEKSPLAFEIDIFNPTSGKVLPLAKKMATELKGNVPVLTGFFAESADGSIILGTRDARGMLQYHPESGFEWITPPNGKAFQPLFCTGHHTFWGYNYADYKTPETKSKKLVEFDYQGNILNDLGLAMPKIPSSHRYIPSGDFFYQKKGPDNLVSTFQYRHQQPTAPLRPLFSTIRVPDDIAPMATFLDQGRLFACDNKIIEVKSGKTIIDLYKELPELKDFGINAWRIDNSSKLWIGTDFGLAIIDIQPSKFKTWLFNGDNSKMGISVRGILPLPDNSVCVNTEGYGQWRIFNKSGNVVPAKGGLKLISFGLGKDDTGNIYYSASANDLIQLSPGDIVHHYKGTIEHAACFFNDASAKKLWIGTRGNGLVVFDLEKNQVTKTISYNGFPELSKANIFYIEKDKSGNLWASSDKGFYQVDPQKGVIARYWSGGKGQYYMPHDFFVFSYIDNENIFWLVTYGGGLLRWDKKLGKVRHFGLESGFLTEYNYAVYEDTHGHFWIPGNYGITQFDKVNEEVRKVFSTYDGLTNQEFNATSHARGTDGTLFFGGLNGLVSFHPDDFYDTTSLHKVPLVLTGCRQYDSSLGKSTDLTEEVLKSHTIRLAPNNRFFSIDLALLAYEELPEIRYAYRFDNEERWIFHNDKTLEFGNLSYGVHTLHLSAITAKGLKSANELTLEVIQLRPFYLQFWFILLSLSLIIGGFIAYVKWHTWRLKANQKVLEGKILEATEHIKQQADQLKHLDEVKSRFFANISHELRTPLTLILGPVQTMMKQGQVEKRDYNLLKMAHSQGKSLLKLVNQLLDLTKLESGKLELKTSQVQFFPFLNRIVAAFESQARHQQQVFNFNYKAPENLQLMLDAPKIETILYNLLSNALKFTPPGGTILLEASESADEIEIMVSDTGRGIHPDDLPRIFDRFYQSNQPDALVEGGTGIGLALCRELSGLMGGSIRAASPYPVGGKNGSAFYLKFPKVYSDIAAGNGQKIETAVFDDEPENIPADDVVVFENSTTELQDKRKKILVVEDNNDLREYLRLILSDRYQVTTAEHGQAALDYLNSAKPEIMPDLILSDIMMPVMDGFQLLEKLKDNSTYRTIPFIMLTARANMQDKLMALRIGVDDYLLKPFEEEELIARIENLLKNYVIRMEMRALLDEKEETQPAEIKSGKTPQPANETERQWIESLETLIKNNIGNSLFSSDFLAEQVGISHRQLQRKVIAFTGLTLQEYIAEIRMCEARRLLENDANISIKELSTLVGFSSRKYFSSLFKSRFGKMPSEYLTEMSNNEE